MISKLDRATEYVLAGALVITVILIIITVTIGYALW